MSVSTVSRIELASLVALDVGTGSWFVVGKPDADDVQSMQAALEGVLGTQVRVVTVSGGDDLLAAVRSSANEVAIFDSQSPVKGLDLDELRSNLMRAAPALLMVSPSSLDEIADVAPHFTSWAGSRVFAIVEDRFLDVEARSERIAEFQRKYGFDDREFIGRVERAELVPDAELAEWLVLLGRGDLLEPRA